MQVCCCLGCTAALFAIHCNCTTCLLCSVVGKQGALDVQLLWQILLPPWESAVMWMKVAPLMLTVQFVQSNTAAPPAGPWLLHDINTNCRPPLWSTQMPDTLAAGINLLHVHKCLHHGVNQAMLLLLLSMAQLHPCTQRSMLLRLPHLWKVVPLLINTVALPAASTPPVCPDTGLTALIPLKVVLCTSRIAESAA